VLQPASGNGPCTAVWTSGTIAYRCKTCAVSTSSAVRLQQGLWVYRECIVCALCVHCVCIVCALNVHYVCIVCALCTFGVLKQEGV
jgi:hypothetical protein